MQVLHTRPVFILIVSNMVTLVLALWERWSLAEVLWIYWAQSVVIGVFHVRRMSHLKDFSTQGFSSGGRQVTEDAKGLKSTVNFFILHYGIFHFGYASILSGGSSGDAGWLSPFGALGILACVASFAWGQMETCEEFIERDQGRRPNLGTMMFLPYCRVIPMHLTMILGSQLEGEWAPLAIFLGLKTLADLATHVMEQRWL